MVWLNWLLTHPGEVMQVLKVGFQIAHKLAIKRRARRLAKKEKEKEEKRQAVYKYNGKNDLK
jgi:hypothetical protein